MLRAKVPADPAIPEEKRLPLPAHNQPQVVPEPDDLPSVESQASRPEVPHDIPGRRTVVQIRLRLTPALQELKAFIMGAVLNASDEDSRKTPAQWEAPLLLDQFLLVRPRHGEEGVDSVALLLERRLRWAWKGQWDEVLADAARASTTKRLRRSSPSASWRTSLDFTTALQHANREVAFRNAATDLPKFELYLRAWYEAEVEHYWRPMPGPSYMLERRPRRPAIPLVFGMAKSPQLLDSVTRCTADGANPILTASQDDIKLVADAPKAASAWAAAKEVWSAAGAVLDESRCAIWAMRGNLPEWPPRALLPAQPRPLPEGLLNSMPAQPKARAASLWSSPRSISSKATASPPATLTMRPTTSARQLVGASTPPQTGSK